MEIHRDKYFKAYVEKTLVECYTKAKGYSAAQAKDVFKYTFFDDFAMLVFIMNSTFPNTVREGDDYAFITDDLFHSHIEGGLPTKGGNVGRLTLRLKNCIPTLLFDNKTFVHGHARGDGGSINCYGDYMEFMQNVCEIGFSGALMDLYNFARVSHHNTKWGNVNVVKVEAYYGSII